MPIGLGNETNYQETRSKLKLISTGSPLTPGKFKCSTNGVAVGEDLACKTQESKNSGQSTRESRSNRGRRDAVGDGFLQPILDICPWFVRVYGILTMADIATEFQTLLGVTMLPPRDQDDTAHAALRSPSSG